MGCFVVLNKVAIWTIKSMKIVLSENKHIGSHRNFGAIKAFYSDSF